MDNNAGVFFTCLATTHIRQSVQFVKILM